MPERMIVAPSVGVFRPLDDVDEGDHVDEGQTVGDLDGPGTSTPVLQPVRAARSMGMLVHPRRTPPRGPAGRLAASRLSDARLRSSAGAPPSPSSGSPTPTSSSASTPATSGSSSAPASASAASPAPGETTATLAIEAGAAAIKHAGLTPDDIDLLIVATATPEQLIPHTGAFVGDGARHALRVVRPQRRRARASSTSSSSARRCSTAGNLDHVLVVGAETLSPHHRPRRPRHRASSSATAPPRWCSARRPTTAPACSPGTSAATARPPACSRSPPAAAACPPRAETVAERRALHEDGRARRCSAARSASSSSRRPPRSSGPASTVDDVAWFVPHQANLRIIEAAANRLGIPPERTLVNIDRYGNTSSASIPLALAEAADDGRVQRRRPRPVLRLRRRPDVGQRAAPLGRA